MDTIGGSESTGLERRTLLKGAAWSLPVIAVAAAAPTAAASAPGALSITFAVVDAELRWNDIFAGFLYITNLTGTDIDNEPATLVLSGFPSGDEPAATVEYPANDALLDDGEQEPRTVQNSALPLLSTSAGSLTLYSGSFTLADGASLLIGFYLRRPAFNVVEKVFFVAGRLTIGDLTAELSGDDRLRVALPDEPA